MAEQRIEEDGSTKVGEAEKENQKKMEDPELFSCLLQPLSIGSDPDYIGIHRLLLYRKAEAGVRRRGDWKCNEKGYVAFRNYIRRPRNWESSYLPSLQSTPGNSGRWIPPPSPLSLLHEVESWSSSKDLHSHQRSSFSSNASDNGLPHIRKVELAYSFVGMHCIFDQCKASVTVVKFGHMSSDILAYGASDGTLTVCNVSEPSSVKHLMGHSKDVTGWTGWYCFVIFSTISSPGSLLISPLLFSSYSL